MKTKLSIFSFSAAIIGALIPTVPAQAVSMFDNKGIFFEKDTKVQFDFLQSNGWWRSDFGVKNLDTGIKDILLTEVLNVDPGSGRHNDNKGTPGIAVKNTRNSFTFEADINYTFFLTSFNKNGNPDTPYNTQYSTTTLNPTWYKYGTGDGVMDDGKFKITENDYDSSIDGTIIPGEQRALFSGKLLEENLANILFEDNTTWGNNDFDDFVVQASIQDDGGEKRVPGRDTPTSRDLLIEDVPEPATFAGLALVVGGIFLSGSCKKQN
jgi:hypothetical protein